MSLPRFGVTRPVPVNLLMTAILIAGLVAAFTLRREFFPETSPDMASVTMPYPGATPEEVEQSLAIKIEDALYDLEEVSQLTTTVSEGGGGIMVEFREGIRDIYRATDEVQRAIDQLMDLPEEAERIRVAEFEPRLPVIMLTLYGEADEDVLKRALHRIRDDLLSLPRMGDIAISGVRNYEIRIDVSSRAMLEHGISLPQITDAVRNWMREVPGGTVRAEFGNINIRTMGVEERSEAIRDILLRAAPDGTALRVGDVAEVREDFVDEEILRRFNGKPAVSLTVFKVGDQDIVAMAEMVRAYVDGRKGRPFVARGLEHIFGSTRREAYELGVMTTQPMPEGTQIATHSDLAKFVEDRLDLLLRNAGYGAILVFLTLLFFLNWRVAFWVGVGLTTALAGTLVMMQALDITLNLLTMFGLIVVLGLLVDDAIVVAENIQARHDRGEASLTAAVKGAEQVTWPVVATVLTSIVAFAPLSFVKGRIGDLLGALPLVVACALLMSLLESLMILPSHMGHSLVKRDKARGGRPSLIQRFEQSRDQVIFNRIVPAFGRFLNGALKYRYVSFAVAVSVLIVSLGMVAGGQVGYTFLQDEDSETIIIDLRFPVGTSIAQTDAFARRFEEAAVALPETMSVSTNIGQRADIEAGQTEAAASHLAQIFVELHPVEKRDRESSRIIADIRDRVGPIPEAERVRFSEITGGPGGPDITVRVRGDEMEPILEAVEHIKNDLRRFAGVYDIADDNTLGQREVQINLLPTGAALGFTTTDVANQVRGALFGLDAHVFAADREDIDVRVRLDEATRRDLHAIENLWLIPPPAAGGSGGSPAGRLVPLTEIAELVEGTSYSTITRVDRKRAITVTADTAPGISPEDIVGRLNIEQLRRDYPMLSIELAGRQEQQRDAFATLPIGFGAALIVIYVILAWLFSSYIQPIAVMLAIPFGIIGVVWGHLLLGFDLTFLSMIGFVALSGVIVNDSLILIRFYNTKREEGGELRESLVAAGKQRLRPIFLTTITTVLGLTPLMLEQSFQARFLIPMAIAIAFGLMAATMVILVVLPSMMVIFDDIKRIAYFLWYGRRWEERIIETGTELELSAE